MLGGGLQLFAMMLSAKLFPQSAELLPAISTNKLNPKQQLHFISSVVLSVTLSLYIARKIGISNDYWAAMTALIILKPDHKSTLERSISRLIGTLTGCCFAIITIFIFHGQQFILFLLLTLTSGAAFAMQKAHYALLTAMISATIVFLIGLSKTDPIIITEHRIIATLLGGSIALTISYILQKK